MIKKIITSVLVISLAFVIIASASLASCGKFGGVVNDEYWAKAWADKSAGGSWVWVEARLHDTYGTKLKVAETSNWEYAYVETSANWGICVDYCYATYDYQID